jgi:hypothetical protein
VHEDPFSAFRSNSLAAVEDAPWSDRVLRVSELPVDYHCPCGAAESGENGNLPAVAQYQHAIGQLRIQSLAEDHIYQRNE